MLSSMSLLPVEYLGLLVPGRPAFDWYVLPTAREHTQSTNQTRTLRTIVPANIARKSTMQVPKRSWGRIPTEYANEDMPCLASEGS